MKNSNHNSENDLGVSAAQVVIRENIAVRSYAPYVLHVRWWWWCRLLAMIPAFFRRRLESIRRLSSTIAPKLLIFQAPNLLTDIIDDCALFSSAFELFFLVFDAQKR